MKVLLSELFRTSGTPDTYPGPFVLENSFHVNNRYFFHYDEVYIYCLAHYIYTFT